MSRILLCLALLLGAAGLALAEEPAADVPREDGPKELSGMSILGNREAPKALVIVPWKSSEIGGSVEISPVLDDSIAPVDKDVFLRALRYHEIRSAGSADVQPMEGP